MGRSRSGNRKNATTDKGKLNFVGSGTESKSGNDILFIDVNKLDISLTETKTYKEVDTEQIILLVGEDKNGKIFVAQLDPSERDK